MKKYISHLPLLHQCSSAIKKNKPVVRTYTYSYDVTNFTFYLTLIKISGSDNDVPRLTKKKEILDFVIVTLIQTCTRQFNNEFGNVITSEEYESGNAEENNNLIAITWNTERIARLYFQFTLQSGKTFNVRKGKKNCLFCLEKFLDDKLIQVIVDQTNLYAI